MQRLDWPRIKHRIMYFLLITLTRPYHFVKYRYFVNACCCCGCTGEMEFFPMPSGITGDVMCIACHETPLNERVWL